MYSKCGKYFFSYASLNVVTLDGETVFRDAVRLSDSPFISKKAAMGDYQVDGSYQCHNAIVQLYCTNSPIMN